MQVKRVMRFIGNRAEPEKELFNSHELFLEQSLGVDWKTRTPASMSIADLREFSKTCPNPLFSDFAEKESGLYPKNIILKARNQGYSDLMDGVNYTYNAISRNALFGTGVYAKYPVEYSDVDDMAPPKPVEEEFTVNLTEPLVGWRRWRFTKETGSPVLGLRSLNSNTLWRPGDAYKAKCRVMMGKKHSGVPGEKCSCGVYAVDSPNSLPEKTSFWTTTAKEFVVTGLVYGWGRYVRGEDGWRCEFAYPKEFHLKSYQAHLVEPLKAWHVPIIIDQPLRVYNPEDEGYANGYGEDDQDRNIRASSEPNPEED